VSSTAILKEVIRVISTKSLIIVMLFAALSCVCSSGWPEDGRADRIEGLIDWQPHQTFMEYRDPIARIRITRQLEENLWLVSLAFAVFDTEPKLPPFENRLRLGFFVKAKDCPGYNLHLLGWAPDQEIYAMLQLDRSLRDADVVIKGMISLNTKNESFFGLILDDFQYPLFGQLHLKAQAQWWQGKDFCYQYGLSWHYRNLQLYYLNGEESSWGIRFTYNISNFAF